MKKIVRFIFSKNLFLLVSLLLQLAFIVTIFVITNNYLPEILLSVSSLIAFIVALLINNTNQHSDIKISYIILLVLFPVYGVLTYIFSMLGWGKRNFNKHLKRLDLQTRNMPQNADVVENLTSEKTQGIANYMYTAGNFPIYNRTNCQYFNSGEAMFDCMVQELEKAEKFIFLEYYIIEHGVFLDTIVDILARKVKEGVEVRFMYDGTSSIAKIPHSFPKEMKKLGINCKMFMPVRAILSTEQNNRDHRKIMIVDNKVAFTGGINLADEYINAVHPFGYWKDVGIKLEGKAVTTLTQMFLKLWNFKSKQIEDFAPYLQEIFEKENDGYFIPIGDYPNDNEDISKTLILHILNNARRYVHITTPYLVLDDELANAIANCAKRGVDISIITPNKPDKKLIFYVTQTNYKRLIDAGCKIYQFVPGFIHAKMIISDDHTAVLGTVNLDYRSLFLNFENSVYINNNSQISEIEKDFQTTVMQSKLIDKTAYKKIKLSRRFVGRLLKIIAPLL